MRLIYQNAQTVIIWLGASNIHVDWLFDWMIALDKQVLAIARPHTLSTWENQWSWLVWHVHGQPPPDEIRKALISLLKQKWFSRIWVLQEAALAKSAMITCGRREVNSRTFVVMPSLLNVDCGEGVQSRLDILPGLFRANSWWAGGSSKDLLTLVQKFGKSNASDHRDVIYALLGLSGDAHSSQILRPNYEMSLQETIQQSMAYFMMETHDILNHVAIQALPQWSLSVFLDSLSDLPLHIFQWAADNAQDKLLYYILFSMRERHTALDIQPYVTYGGRHGPPISIAIKKENWALLELLLQFPDTDVETKDLDGNTPLSIAVGQGNMVVANSILERRQQNAHTRDSRGNTPLLVAATQGVSVFRAFLLKHPELEIYSRDFGGDTQLMTAIKQGDSTNVELILYRSEAEMHIADSNGDGPLNIAARRGDEDIVDLLLERIDPKHIAFRGSDGLTPLESAFAGGFSGIIKKLLEYPRVHPVCKAARANQFDFLRIILDVKPLLVDADLFQSRTPLGVAAEAGSTQCVRLLLDRGARINAGYCDEQPAAPLWIAASRGHLDTVILLVERGAILELTTMEHSLKTTALWIAALNGHLDVVTFLLKVGAKVRVEAEDELLPYLKERRGDTAFLGAAICVGHREAVWTLVEAGVDVNKSTWWEVDPETRKPERVGQNWARPLWVAASLGYADMVTLLIQHGADIEARDSYYGMTTFQRAAQQKRSEVMTVLAEAGADTRLKQ